MLNFYAYRSVLILDVESDDENHLSSGDHVHAKKRHLPVTPHPPSSVKPQPPSKQLKRPHTAGDFRSRRYRPRSVEEPVQFVDTSHHDTGSDSTRNLQSQLDSRRPDHLTDINEQYQDIHSRKKTVSSGHDPEHSEAKPSKKWVHGCIVNG